MDLSPPPGAVTAPGDWPVRSKAARVSGFVLLVLFGVFSGAFLTAFAALTDKLFTDFFGFWSASRFLASHPAMEVYDRDALTTFQHQLYPQFTSSFPFIYPPLFLLIIWPLGLLPYGAAFVLWVVLTVVPYVVALCAPVWRRPVVAALLVAPTTTFAFVYGQSGVLASALLFGGLRLLTTRPVLAGVLLGLAGFKPQLALLVPVALLAAGCWRTIVSAAATFLAGVAASSLAFGWSIWPGWVHVLAGRNPILPVDRVRLDTIMPTVSASLDLLGFPPVVTHLIQAGFALAAAGVTWWMWRGGPTRLGIATLAAAALLATPYGFLYDMVLTTGAVLLVIEDATTRGIALTVIELLVLSLALALPPAMILPTASAFPVSMPVLAALVAVILRRAARSGQYRRTSPISA
jgi:Glycosyltransferase family 87